MAPEIRFTITERLDEILKTMTDKYGVDKSDYVRSLIINDLRAKEGKSDLETIKSKKDKSK